MRYLGGKSKIRKQVATVLELMRKPGQVYFEPFCGGGWVLQEMTGPRIASDGNAALVTMYQSLQAGWVPPDFVSEELWRAYKNNPRDNDPMTAFCGFGCSFAGKWFGGYARSDGKICYAATTARSLAKQLPLIRDVEFRHGLYGTHAPVDCLIYCDPPYAGTTQYGAFDGFDHLKFWETMREWAEKGNTVIVSEYTAPPDWVCVYECESRMGLTTDGERPKRIERMFMYGA